jgi:transposase
MGSLTALRTARQTIFLEFLAETGSLTTAAQRAGVHISVPAHWRRRYPAFAKAERKAKQQAAKRLVERARQQP